MANAGQPKTHFKTKEPVKSGRKPTEGFQRTQKFLQDSAMATHYSMTRFYKIPTEKKKRTYSSGGRERLASKAEHQLFYFYLNITGENF